MKTMPAVTARKRVSTRLGAPVGLPSHERRARCGICQTHRPWPVALPGTAKRFFCMTCERNTIHQQIK
jgi:hypothetical protein